MGTNAFRMERRIEREIPVSQVPGLFCDEVHKAFEIQIVIWEHCFRNHISFTAH
jgi:hypothetical protein